MKVLLVLIIALIASFFYFFYPLVHKEKICYDTSAEAVDMITYNFKSGRFGEEDVCSKRSIVLMDLEDCISNSTSSSTIAKYANTYIQQVLSVVQPNTKNLWIQKASHNEECNNYINYQLN